MAKFTVGQTVYRLEEDRVDVEATVHEIQTDDGNVLYLIDYIEGGSGWWGEDHLTSTSPA